MLVKFKCPLCGYILETKRRRNKKCLCRKAILWWVVIPVFDDDDDDYYDELFKPLWRIGRRDTSAEHLDE